jgi:hypothetical protein
MVYPGVAEIIRRSEHSRYNLDSARKYLERVTNAPGQYATTEAQEKDIQLGRDLVAFLEANTALDVER